MSGEKETKQLKSQEEREREMYTSFSQFLEPELPPLPFLDALLCFSIIAGCILYCCSEQGSQVLAAAIVPLSSEIDWCEDNFVYSDQIAEFWNSISSLTQLVVVLLFIYTATVNGFNNTHSVQLFFLGYGLLFISLGSFYFHMRLR